MLRGVMVAMLLAVACPVAAGERLLLAQLSLDQAARKVMERSKGRILSASTANANGRKVHVFKVLTPDGRIQHIKVDAASGRIIGR